MPFPLLLHPHNFMVQCWQGQNQMRIIYTRHARQRMKQRNVTEKEVEDTLAHPDEIEPGDNGGEIAIRRYGIREVRVVYGKPEEDTYLVYTVIKPRIQRRHGIR